MGASPGGVVAGVVRFLAHIPLFLYGVNGIQDLKFFQKHATIILQQPLGNVVLVAEKMGGGMGIFAFAWNFVMWIPTTLCPPELLFFVGIVDAGITVSMIAATAIQGGYYGKTNGQCGRLPPAPGTITTDRGLVFLQRLQEISPDDEGYPESTCKHFLLKYYAGVVAIILYSIMTIASLGFGLSAWYDYGTRPRYGAGRSARRQNCFTISNLVYVTTCPLRIPIVALAAVLACLGRCLIGLFPHSIQNKLYFARRWVSKWAVGQQRSAAKVNTKVNTKLSSIPRHVRAKTFRDKSSRASLSKVLEVAPIIPTIAQHLHHLDLVNLSLASKLIYQALYAPSIGAGVEEKETHKQSEPRYLRVLTCSGNEKLQCWGCGIQGCKDCTTTRPCRPSAVTFHMKLCRARCSKCTFEKIPNWNWDRRCTCSQGGRDERDPKALRDRSNNQLAESVRVCWECGRKTPDEIMEMRAERDREVYRRLVQQPLACDVCSEALKRSGPIWWVCSVCKRECCSEEHPGWGRKVEV